MDITTEATLTAQQTRKLIGKIALGQTNPTTGDLVGNTEKIIEFIREAKRQGDKIIVLPETAISGYCLGDTIEYEDFVRDNRTLLERIAKESVGIAVVIGFIDYNFSKINENGAFTKYNAAAVLNNGEIKGIVHKQNLPNYRYFDDKRYYSEGEQSKPIIVEVDGQSVKLGVLICEDLWDEHYKRKPVHDLAIQGADILISINASPFGLNKGKERSRLIQKAIAETGKPFVYLNTVGVADNGKNIIPFDGGSVVYDENGRIIAAAARFKEELKTVDLVNYSTLSELITPSPFLKEDEYWNALVLSLKDYMKKCGFTKVVVPVSGGIDSALALAICVAAIGAENVIAYNLPTVYNTETTKAIAAELCANLGVEMKTMPIQLIFNDMVTTFESFAHKITKGVTKENMQARIRGMLMMAESNDENRLLISCGNETEIALGYCTLYGDMSGGLSLIGDLNKVWIYRLSHYANRWFGKEVIPERTFKIRPSAELAEGQYDPFDYTVEAPLVDELSDRRRSPRQVIEMYKNKAFDTDEWSPDSEGKTVYDKFDLGRFSDLVYRRFANLRMSVHKRLQGAPIPAISDNCFGFDNREPIINKYTGRPLEKLTA